jgi:epoxyqueuosine reductase QueG
VRDLPDFCPSVGWLSDTDPQARLEKTAQRILDKIQYLDDKIDERLAHSQMVQMEHGMTLRNISNEVGQKKPKILAVKDVHVELQGSGLHSL